MDKFWSGYGGNRVRGAYPVSASIRLTVVLVATVTGTLVGGAQMPPRFGVMTHFAHGWNPEMEGNRLARLGVELVRDELYWDRVELSPGRYVIPAAYNAYLDRLTGLKVEPLIALSFANPLYDGGLTPYSPQGIAAFANYGAEVVAKYPGKIQAVEVWNEYNGSFAEGVVTEDRARYYTELLAETYRRIKVARPEVTVVGGATSGLPMPYWEKLLQHGALKHLDVVSIHPYRTQQAPEGIEEEIAEFQTLLAQYADGREVPIWVSEIGWPLRVDPLPGQLEINELTQAQFLVRAYALLAGAGVERVYWYLLRDTGNFATMGLFRDQPEHSAKLAAEAARVLQREIGTADSAQQVPTIAGLYVTRFDLRDGTVRQVVWAPHEQTISLTGATKVQDMWGQETDLSPTMLIGPSPIYVEGRLRAVPPPVTEVKHRQLADSVRDFSMVAGQNGWSYGTISPRTGEFFPLARPRVTDWKIQWVGLPRYMTISARGQHPGLWDKTPVPAVRRWVSPVSGAAKVAITLRCSEHSGGVDFRLVHRGEVIARRALGGGEPVSTTVTRALDLVEGGELRFEIGAGADGQVNFDAVTLEARIWER